MKKIITISCCLLLVLGFLLPVKTKAATEVSDQKCGIAAGEGGGPAISDEERFRANQTFTPAKNRLTKVSAYLRGTGTGRFHIDLYHGESFIAKTTSAAEPNGDSYVSVSFPSPITLTPGDGSYKIIVRKNDDNAVLYWFANWDCYSGGMAYLGDTPLGGPDSSFGFITFGYDETSPSGESGTSTTPTSSANQNQLQNNASTSDQAQNQKDSASKGKAAQQGQKILSWFESMPLWQKIFNIVGIIIVLAGIGFLIYRAVKRRKPR